MPKFEGTPIEVYNKTGKRIEKHHNKEKIVVYISTKETKEMRTFAQNSTLHKIVSAIGQFNSWSIEDAKKYTLIYCFSYFTHEYKGETILIPQKTSTKELKKHEAIKYIDFIIEYCKENDIGVVITPREITSLYNSYN